MPRATYKGIFTPKNPKKYIGNVDNIVFRSLWEKQVMEYLDGNPAVITWGSEEVPIPYISPIDNKPHRYFPDFIARIRGENAEKVMILEVKPKAQTKPPKPQNQITKRFLTEMMTYQVNKTKFEAAEQFCAKQGWEFSIITEDDLKLKPSGKNK